MLKDLEKMLKGVSENRTFLAVLTVLLTLYVVFSAPKLPEVLRRLFELPVFRFLVLFLVAYFAKYRNPTIALVVALAFLFVTNLLSEGRLLESYNNIAQYESFKQRVENFEDEEDEDEFEEEEEEEEEAEDEAEAEAEEEVKGDESSNMFGSCNCAKWSCENRKNGEEDAEEESAFSNYQRRLATGSR